MLSVALLSVALLAPASVPPARPAVAPALIAAAVAFLAPQAAKPAEPAGPRLTPQPILAETCTEGSVRYEGSGECCGANMSKTFQFQQKCVNGEWTYTGFTRCSLPICPFIP